MASIFPFNQTLDSWEAPHPERHWREGYSAQTLARSWNAAHGFPPEVAAALATEPSFAGIVPVLGVPEFKVPLRGGDRPSHNDIFVLVRSAAGPVSIMVEGKVEESFGPFLGGWLSSASADSGKRVRLDFLLKALGLREQPHDGIRYQLLHRAASAVLEGDRYRAAAAVLLVHSFSDQRTGWEDFEAFCGLFGAKPELGRVLRLPGEQAVPLFAVWVEGDRSFLGA